MKCKIIGGYAMNANNIHIGRKSLDVDLIGDREGAYQLAGAFGDIVKTEETKNGIIIFTDNECNVVHGEAPFFPIEAELIEKSEHTAKLYNAMDSDNLGLYANKNWLYFLKMSHRYKKNSPHFLKTMMDIHRLRDAGAKMPIGSEELFKEREKLTYDYSHPKLNVKKGEFFDGDGVNYIYDHDSIHLAVALESKPAYMKYMRDDAEVLSSKEKFFSVDEATRTFGVYEEACVLALERSQIPFDFKPTPRQSFIMALQKVCTSITSGWFREYAWENYREVVKLYRNLGEDDYVNRFKNNFHLIKPFEGK